MTRRSASVLALLLLGCGGDGSGASPDAGPAESLRFEARLIGHVQESSSGQVRGLNLDERVSDGTDAEGCFAEDWTDSVRDQPGIDNAMLGLIASSMAQLFVREGPTFDEALEAAGVTVPVVLSGVRESREGSIGVSLAGSPPVPATLQGGYLEARTVGTLSIAIEGTTLRVHDLAIDARLTAEGTLEDVVIGGALDVEELVAEVRRTTPDLDDSLLRATLEGVADLSPGRDGICARLSTGFRAVVD